VDTSIPADDRSTGAKLVRGMVLSHRDWDPVDNARAGQQQFRALFE